MAGHVRVYETNAWEGCIDIARERLWWMAEYLTECQKTSAVLQQAGEALEPQSVMLHKYLTLVRHSDALVAEIGRLLIEGAEPSHPFWADGTRFFDPSYGPNRGLDPDAEIKARQAWTQKAFREVAALIQRRLERNAAAAEQVVV